MCSRQWTSCRKHRRSACEPTHTDGACRSRRRKTLNSRVRNAWRALPALSQCLDDSLRRFGTVTLTGLQVTLQDLRPLTSDNRVGDYVSPRNGFNLAGPAGAQAHIAFDHAWLGDRIAELPDRFPNPGAFEFGPVVTGPAPHRIQVPAETPFLRGLAAARLGLAVTLPEWSASAAGWALALALYTTRTVLLPEAPRHCAVRVTRVQ